jgi:hypothetical protein
MERLVHLNAGRIMIHDLPHNRLLRLFALANRFEGNIPIG